MVYCVYLYVAACHHEQMSDACQVMINIPTGYMPVL